MKIKVDLNQSHVVEAFCYFKAMPSGHSALGRSANGAKLKLHISSSMAFMSLHAWSFCFTYHLNSLKKNFHFKLCGMTHAALLTTCLSKNVALLWIGSAPCCGQTPWVCSHIADIVSFIQPAMATCNTAHMKIVTANMGARPASKKKMSGV